MLDMLSMHFFTDNDTAVQQKLISSSSFHNPVLKYENPYLKKSVFIFEIYALCINFCFCRHLCHQSIPFHAKIVVFFASNFLLNERGFV